MCYTQAQYHNYAPMGPHRENLLAYQRTVHDLFIPDKLREDLQRKAEASLQTLPSMLAYSCGLRAI
jgi:PAB-dependent poly(A)-specific ribonuclease subunit 3